MKLIEQANKIVGASLLKSWTPGGFESGGKWKTKNPTREDRNPGSFVIDLSNGIWKDWSTGDAGGDAVSLYAYLHNLRQKKAAEEIIKKWGNGDNLKNKKEYEKPKTDIIVPVPEFHFPPKFENSFFGQLKNIYEYKNKKNELMFYIARYEKNKRKSCIPFCYTGRKWVNRGLDRNLPLYNLPELYEKKELPVLLVEGEKCVDILKKLLNDKFVVVTWSGGTGQIKKTDFEPIKNKEVYYWYDNDDPGKKTIDQIKERCENLIIVHPPDGKPETWDGADAAEEMTKKEIEDFIFSFEQESEEEEIFLDDYEMKFDCLGYSNGYMFFLPHYTGQLFSVREGGLNKHHLMNLEKLEVWQTLYGTETRNGIAVSWDNAIDDVIRKIQDAGPFDVSDLRGRGVWLENGEIIISTGKKIIKEKEEYELKNYKSNHIYERLKEKKMEFSDPAKDDESKKIINCIEKLSFEKKISALYLAGWCVLAPFCGALDWRPHVWITGSSGSGKTTILKYIITPMLGDFSVYTSGLSSGAGIRQKMKNDSFSIVLDEAEPGSYQTGKINEILDLARMSSSEFRGSQVYKGTQAGNGISYKMRSMFCLSSVNTSLNKQADESRFSLISLDQNYKYPWTQLESEIFQTFSDEACKRVRARTMKNISVIRKNAKTFSFAAGSVLGKQRAGDQIGALVAGAMSLYEIKEYKLEEAKKIIKKYNIEINDEDNFSDEMQCFLKIFQSKIIYISEKGKNETTNLMNLVNMANTIPDGSNSNMINVATEELLKYGIRTKDNRVYLASNYAWIKDILQGSEWEHNYSKILRRLSFVDKELSCIRFGNYHRGNAVGIEKSNFEYFSQDKIFEEAGF